MVSSILLPLAKLAIRTFSLKKLSHLFGTHWGVRSVTPIASEMQIKRAVAIGRGLRLAIRYSPIKYNCYPQAISARVLLGLAGVPYTFFMGVCRESGQLKAHAWVGAGAVRICGGYSFDRYTVTACFSSLSRVS